MVLQSVRESPVKVKEREGCLLLSTATRTTRVGTTGTMPTSRHELSRSGLETDPLPLHVRGYPLFVGTGMLYPERRRRSTPSLHASFSTHTGKRRRRQRHRRPRHLPLPGITPAARPPTPPTLPVLTFRTARPEITVRSAAAAAVLAGVLRHRR